MQQGPSSYDPTQGKNTTTQTTYLGQGALVDFSMSSPSVTTIRGTEIQQGDKRLFLGLAGDAGRRGRADAAAEDGRHDHRL